MKAILNDYYSYFPEIDFYFVESDPLQVSMIDLSGTTLTVKQEETYLGILNKTVEAMDYCLTHKPFDFLIRSNLSTIINISNLLLFLGKLPQENVYCGGKVLNLQWLSPEAGITDTSLFGTRFVQGTSIILSKDLVISICRNKKHLRNSIVDDVALGRYIQEYHSAAVSHYQAPFFWLVPDSDISLIVKLYGSTVIFYRTNTNHKYLSEFCKKNDIKKMKELSLSLQPKKCL